MWKTVEHVLNDDQCRDYLHERLTDSDFLLFDLDTELYCTREEAVEAIINYVESLQDQFQAVTAEAIESCPDQIYQDLLYAALLDDPQAADRIDQALEDLCPLNGDLLTYQEIQDLLPTFGVSFVAPISDNYEYYLPVALTYHKGPMNSTQKAFNELVPEQVQEQIQQAFDHKQCFIVDSRQPFSEWSQQFLHPEAEKSKTQG